jgi:hypothetical protein
MKYFRKLLGIVVSVAVAVLTVTCSVLILLAVGTAILVVIYVTLGLCVLLAIIALPVGLVSIHNLLRKQSVQTYMTNSKLKPNRSKKLTGTKN